MNLSIVTINFNNAIGLQKTIDSIISQTYKDWEWIVIDGGSTDNSKQLILKYQSYFTYWCSEKDKGIWDALNKGITQSKGTYICFMNSGDIFYDADTLFDVFSNHIYGDIIYGNTINIKNNKEIKVVHPENISLSYLSNNTINHQSTFILGSLQKSFLYDCKYKYAADRKFWIQAIMNDATFQYINRNIAKYDCGGISSNNFHKVEIEHNTIIHEIIPKAIINDIIQLNHYKRIISDYPILKRIYLNITKKGFTPLLKLLLKIFSQ